MITTPTVFILGAGASCPLGFPTGEKLVTEICKMSSTEPFAQLRIDHGHVEEFQRELGRSGQPSVDAFLEHRQEYLAVGKAAIATILLHYEAQDHPKTISDWLYYLLNRMSTDVTFDTWAENKVSFITFNYDRSLEYHFFHALKSRFGKDDKAVAECLSHIPVLHVYGKLGAMLWESPTGTVKRLKYGNEASVDAIMRSCEGIKILSENTDDTEEFSHAHELMAGASRIAFVGFGYHPVNMRRLKVPLDNKNVQGTCLGMTDIEEQYLGKRYNYKLGLHNRPALEFLRRCGALQDD